MISRPKFDFEVSDTYKLVSKPFQRCMIWTNDSLDIESTNKRNRNFPFKVHFIEKNLPKFLDVIFLYNILKFFIFFWCLECCHFAFIIIVMQFLHVEFAIQDKNSQESNLSLSKLKNISWNQMHAV